mmetsp:Transcript_4594/g.8682  ORF Transcript_4594/g.8682 Transcript_4594/m.8682 type:complete len:271 (-) Transcript_4594:213-1025(-)|eukprot:CAMPEP_0114245598 /NCGR_PEP_ID=MMETSP0058-20121206/11988_1 /TAXON_ID=36894 /ORGANISM="Pyramimonas parkeae, CCMP726" /LENGTH=270 /DNA_ID=CAMNT_0001358675 /DNA_START=62 /DNA_END=874 /DNA_ORIENTATION=-
MPTFISQNTLAARCDNAVAQRSMRLRSRVAMSAPARLSVRAEDQASNAPQLHISTPRREALLTLAAGPALALASPALAVQGLTAGRVPGILPSALEGFNDYTRPDGKSGGHGVGWSEIPKYSFTVGESWEEVPTSIADLGGSEVDLRFSCRPEGDLAVVVAPVLRFYDVGYNASVTIDELGTPEAIVKAFAPEVLGGPIEDDDITRMETRTDPESGLLYYVYDVKPHFLLCATAFKNRLFIMTIRASSVQWRKAKDKLLVTRDSFRVSTK